MNSLLEEKLKLLPDQPGVYFFKDKTAKTLYIGKAFSLKKRVSQYFHKNADEERPNIQSMMDKVYDIEYIVTDTEKEALILEANLVRENKPYYNILLKDDKHFPYIKITISEPFPRVLVTRRVIKDNSKYFGPYTDIRSMRKTLEFLRKIFKIRFCNKTLPLKNDERPCLYFHINRCSGACSGKISRKEYKNRIDEFSAILSGRARSLVDDIKKQIKENISTENFENAAVLRDKMISLQNIMERQKMDESDPDINRDVFALSIIGSDACMIVIRIREGLFLDRNHFMLRISSIEDESESYSSFIKQYYMNQEEIPGEILLPVDISDKFLISEWLKEKKKSSVEIIMPKRGEKVRMLELAMKNADLLLKEDLAKRETLKGETHSAVTAIQKELGLAKPPLRIECFDISTLQGTDTVASVVSFYNAKPKKSDYRHYKIKTVDGQDDFSSINEAVIRRINQIKEEGKDMPDLFLIDGGKGQLSAGVSALKQFNLANQPIAAIAKRIDEIFIPDRDFPVMINKKSPGLRLLQRIRDEAHRFAITFHRKLRDKRTVFSELDAVKGIGTKKKIALLAKFGSLEQIKKASLEELEKTAGKSAAKRLFEYFNKPE